MLVVSLGAYAMPNRGDTLPHRVGDNPLECRKRIGYLPENPPLYTEMTVQAYLRFVAKIKRARSSKSGNPTWRN
jgi:ABC-type multidrug transport system ATPase subunit